MGQIAKKKMKTGWAKKKKSLTRKVLATNGICCLQNSYTNINDVCLCMYIYIPNPKKQPQKGLLEILAIEFKA